MHQNLPLGLEVSVRSDEAGSEMRVKALNGMGKIMRRLQGQGQKVFVALTSDFWGFCWSVSSVSSGLETKWIMIFCFASRLVAKRDSNFLEIAVASDSRFSKPRLSQIPTLKSNFIGHFLTLSKSWPQKTHQQIESNPMVPMVMRSVVKFWIAPTKSSKIKGQCNKIFLTLTLKPSHYLPHSIPGFQPHLSTCLIWPHTHLYPQG